MCCAGVHGRLSWVGDCLEYVDLGSRCGTTWQAQSLLKLCLLLNETLHLGSNRCSLTVRELSYVPAPPPTLTRSSASFIDQKSAASAPGAATSGPASSSSGATAFLSPHLTLRPSGAHTRFVAGATHTHSAATAVPASTSFPPEKSHISLSEPNPQPNPNPNPKPSPSSGSGSGSGSAPVERTSPIAARGAGCLLM